MKQNTLHTPTISSDVVLEMLLKLPPLERIKIFTEAFPETENDLETELIDPKPQKRKSLYGLWKNLGFDITEEDIAEARKEMWGNFPREDI